MDVLQDGVDRVREAAGEVGQILVLGREIADRRRGHRIERLRALQDQVLLGVVVEVRIIEAVVHHPADDVVIRDLAFVEQAQLALERVQKLGQVGVVLVQRVYDVRHLEASSRCRVSLSLQPS